MRVRTLGGFGVSVDGREIECLDAQPMRSALLVYLCVTRDTTRDKALALLWPERDDRTGRHALSQTLYELRRTLGRDWIDARGQRLRITESVETDAADFFAACESHSLDEALSRYAGPFLDGWHLKTCVEFESWVDRERSRLAGLFRDGCRARIKECLACGDVDGAVVIARRWTDQEPLDAEANLWLAELLAEHGDPAAALRHHADFERRLRIEGLDPPPRIDAVLDRLRRKVEPLSDAASSLLPHLIAGDAESPIPRLVVLPFENFGAGDDEYFSDGVTEEITSDLVRLPGLAVIARTSAIQYRNTTKTIARIARELGVDFVLEGTVRWVESLPERRVRISPQLIRASDSSHIWAETYEAIATDLFEVQSRVAERVTEALGIHLEPERREDLEEPATQVPDAHEMFVRGMRQWAERSVDGLDKAVECFQRAIELDPGYTRAYAGLAESYAMISSFTGGQASAWLPKAKRAAERALALDPTCAESHVAAGMVAYVYDWDAQATERHLLRAIELAPSNATAHVGLAYARCTLGRVGEARATMNRARALDPLSVATNFDVGFQSWQARERDRAVGQLRLVAHMAPGFDPGSYVLGGIYYYEGDGDAAREEWQRLTMLGPAWQTLLEVLEDRERAVEVMDRIVEFAPGGVHWYGVSSFYALLGAHDRALRWLEAHYANVRGEPTDVVTGGPSLLHVATDPFYDNLRSGPRFEHLLHRIELGRVHPPTPADSHLTEG